MESVDDARAVIREQTPIAARTVLAHLADRDPAYVLDKTRFFTTVRWTQDLAFVIQRGDRAAIARALRRLREHLA